MSTTGDFKPTLKWADAVGPEPLHGPLVDEIKGRMYVDAILAVLAERERELLDLKGPCSNEKCQLHFAHSGPCGEKK